MFINFSMRFVKFENQLNTTLLNRIFLSSIIQLCKSNMFWNLVFELKICLKLHYNHPYELSILSKTFVKAKLTLFLYN